MTSSPTAGLLVVPFVTVPVRVWAAVEARVRENIAASNADCTSFFKTAPWGLSSRFLDRSDTFQNLTEFGGLLHDKAYAASLATCSSRAISAFRGRGRPRHTCLPRMIASLCVKFMEHVLAADFDFAFVLAGLGEIVGKLHT